MVSPNTLGDEEYFTSASLKTKAGCVEILFLDTTRESILVALNCTLLELPQEEMLQVCHSENGQNLHGPPIQAFRSLQVRFLDGTFDQVGVVC